MSETPTRFADCIMGPAAVDTPVRSVWPRRNPSPRGDPPRRGLGGLAWCERRDGSFASDTHAMGWVRAVRAAPVWCRAKTPAPWAPSAARTLVTCSSRAGMSVRAAGAVRAAHVLLYRVTTLFGARPFHQRILPVCGTRRVRAALIPALVARARHVAERVGAAERIEVARGVARVGGGGERRAGCGMGVVRRELSLGLWRVHQIRRGRRRRHERGRRGRGCGGPGVGRPVGRPREAGV